MYKIEFSVKATKTFLGLPENLRNQLDKKLTLLARNPCAKNKNVSALRGMKKACRLRFGDWRVIYEINDGAVTIVIIKISQRKEVYK